MRFDLAGVRVRLPGRRIEWFPAIDSTMILAAQLAREGCASGTIVGAERQTAGAGRHGRAWHSEEGAGLYVSFVLRLARPAGDLPLVMLALGLAARQAITETTGAAPDLRWPNDVLLNGRKCAGILGQMDEDALIAGIGINVSHAGFPAELAGIATSLCRENAPASREDLLVALARAIDSWAAAGAPAILASFAEASSYVRGKRVRIDQDGVALEGVTCGLDPTGFLRLRQDNGVVTTILAGGVRPA